MSGVIEVSLSGVTALAGRRIEVSGVTDSFACSVCIINIVVIIIPWPEEGNVTA